MSDPIDEAIAGVAAAAEELPEPPFPLQQINTILASGRPAAALLPVDATDEEIADLAGWLLTGVRAFYRDARAAEDALAPKIHTPTGLHVVRPD